MGDVTATGTGATGLGTRAARWALGFVWLLGLAWGAVGGAFDDPGVLDFLPYVTLFVGGYLLSTPGSQPLDPGRAVGVAASSVVSVVLVLAGMETVQDTWLGSLGYYLVALLIARGNPVVGGAGAVLGLAYGLGWAIRAGASAEAITDLLAIPVVAVVVGVSWRVVLRRVVARERAHRTDAARAAREAEAATEAAEANRRELAEIQRQVAPLLSRIAAGESLEALRVELGVTEGAIRDRIRSPGLQHPLLTFVIADRRRQGVQVLLLGEGGDDEGGVGSALIETISGIVAGATGGRVTVRVVPPGRGPGASVVVEQDGVLQRTMIAPDGTVMARY